MSTDATIHISESRPLDENALLGWYSKFVCVYVLFVIFAGALVTSHDAGLSVPDWPTSYGQNMFLFPVYKWVGGIYYEHSHRLVAFGVGTLTLILALWTAIVEKRKWVRVLTYVAFVAVICQGMLGGLTVVFGLPDAISVAHGVLAQTFMVIVIVIAYSHAVEFKSRSLNASTTAISSASKASLAVCFLIYLQLVIGAIMRHTGSGLAILDFPLVLGHVLPAFDDTTLLAINASRKLEHLAPVTITQVLFHFLHRVGALVVSASVIWLVQKLVRDRGASFTVKRNALFILVILLIQFGLGVASLLSLRNPVIASVHVVTGALLLGTMVILALRLTLNAKPLPQ